MPALCMEGNFLPVHLTGRVLPSDWVVIGWGSHCSRQEWCLQEQTSEIIALLRSCVCS